MRKESLAKIASAALATFAEYGYHGATLKKLTQATGLSYGLVYHYFSSKEEIFLHLVKEAFGYARSTMATLFENGGTAWEKIVDFSETLAREIRKKELPYYFIITQQAMIQARDIPGVSAYVASQMEYYQKFDELIAEAQESGDVIGEDPELLSSAYLALFHGMVLMTQHQEDLKSRVTPDIFTNLLQRKST
jgi:AcrR family transcriptional regulator